MSSTSTRQGLSKTMLWFKTRFAVVLTFVLLTAVFSASALTANLNGPLAQQPGSIAANIVSVFSGSQVQPQVRATPPQEVTGSRVVPITEKQKQAEMKRQIVALRGGKVKAETAAPRSPDVANAIRVLTGCTTNTLPANDDDSTEAIPLPFTLNYFGTTFPNVFINNNGNVTFAQPLGDYTPFSLNTTNTPIIAPFFADVDTRGAGSGVVQYGNTMVNGRTAFCANWVNVGYYAGNDDLLNSFQLILIERSDTGAGNFDIEFNYNQIVWETGDASGGSGGQGGASARAGYANGSMIPGTFLELPGSAVNGGLEDSNIPTGLTNNSLNSGGVLGRYIFSARNGGIAPSCISSQGVVRTLFDFDGDKCADISIFRPSDRVWYLNGSTSGFSAVEWGLPNDRLASADYDGDGKTDIGSFRGDSGDPDLSYFYIINSLDGSLRKEQFGRLGDVSLPAGDWDGDGKADLAIYRDGGKGGQSYFFYRPSSQPGVDFVSIPWGVAGDKPMRGDFDGDGKLDAAVFRPSDNTWYILQSSDGQIRYQNWGLATDRFVPGDYDNDGKTDLAVFRDGVWYILQSLDGQPTYQPFGLNTDTLVPADYDGDGKTDKAIFRDGDWYILQSRTGEVSYMHFGLPGDVPVPSAYTQ